MAYTIFYYVRIVWETTTRNIDEKNINKKKWFEWNNWQRAQLIDIE